MCLGFVLSVVPLPGDAAQWASGVIVKLKSSTSMASNGLPGGGPTTLSFDSSTRVRMRLASAALRNQVPFSSQRPTAFAAHVLRSEHPLKLAEAQAQAERLQRDPDVEWAMPNAIEKPASLETDPYYFLQTWLQSRDAGLRGVADVPKAWLKLASPPQPLSRVVVALLDTGVLPHPDLEGRYLPGYDFVSVFEYARDGDGLDADATDPGSWLTELERDQNKALYGDCEAHPSSWHGLAIAGMLAANTHNGIDGAGMLAPLSGPVVLPVRVAGICGAEVSDIVEGMLWAAGIPYQGSPKPNPHPARVVNLSFGGDGPCVESGVRDTAWLYRRTVAALKARGTLVVASAGNGDENGALAEPTRPANCEGVLAVTALHEQGFKASYANFVDARYLSGLATVGGDVDTAVASRRGVWTTSNTGQQQAEPTGYTMTDPVGTSFSAPIVAGVAAMMLAIDPYLSVDELVAGLTGSATPHISRDDVLALRMPDLPNCLAGVEMGQCYCTTSTCGSGRLDAEAAINYAMAQLRDHPTGTTRVDLTPDTSFFTPTRAQVSGTSSVNPPKGGAGGGALDPSSLAVVALMMWLTLIGGGRR